MASQHQGNKRETRDDKLVHILFMNSVLSHQTINAWQELERLVDFVSIFEAIFSHTPPPGPKSEKEREKEVWEKMEKKKKKKMELEACLIFNPIFTVHWSLKVISSSHKLHCDAKKNFLACLYKSKYDSWKIWDLWVRFYGRTKLLMMNTKCFSLRFQLFRVFQANFDCLTFRIWRKLLHESCISLSLENIWISFSLFGSIKLKLQLF